MNNKGFILITMLFLMILVAVTALVLNVRAGMQVRMTSNQAQAIQTYLGEVAAVENAKWRLTKDPCWRTGPAGEDYTYGGVTYNRKVLNSPVSNALGNYTDAVVISVQASDGARSVRSSLRYYADTPFLVRKPNQIFCDRSNSVYFADSDNHSVWKIEASTGAISRVAGNGKSGFSGDGGPAIQAQLNAPLGVCADVSGNLYVSDTGNHRIRKVDASGRITTVAGTGTAGYSGDEVPASTSQLSSPQQLFVDASGNLYIADRDNHRIRKVDAAPPYSIHTVSGNGSPGFSGDGGPATAAMLKKPCGIFVASAGNLYIADTDNQRIRKVSADPPYNITTVAGGGAGLGDGGPATNALLAAPRGVFVDDSGNIWIADTGNHRIRMVRTATGIITTVAGSGWAGYSGDGGAAVLATIDNPSGVYLRNTGDLTIADTANCCLRVVSAGGVISTVAVTAGPGLANPGQLAAYYDNIAQRNYVLIADTNNHRIRKFDTLTNSISTVAGTGVRGASGDGGPATSAMLDSPRAVFANADGCIYIADTGNHVIRKVDASGMITAVAGKYVQGYDTDGHPATSRKLNAPCGVFVDGAGNIFIADTGNNSIRKVDPATDFISTVAGTGIAGYSGDGGTAAGALLNGPRGVFADGSGNIYIADTENNRVRKVSAQAGIISTVAGNGSPGYSGDGGPADSAMIRRPHGVFVDGAGNVFIADTENHAIRIVNIHDGKINTLVGVGGTGGFNGDNLPAVTANLNMPGGVAMAVVKGGGRIYVSDTANNRIRKLALKIVRELY